MRPGSEIRPLAVELNEVIERENPHVYAMLSDMGKRLYFPKGILSQSAEAKEKATKFDATIGIAKEDGKPMFLPSIMQYLDGLTPAEALTYAPATGRADLRKKWREELLAKNPSLAGRGFSTPVVTSGVTHALSLVGDLFVEKGDLILLPDKFWENYELLFAARFQAQIALYPFFNEKGGFNVEGLRKAIASRTGSGKAIVILNFPNNPTGYSITKEEGDAVSAALWEAAEDGCNLVVVTDDAYFGLFYGENTMRESLFARLAGSHDRILAVKVDGPTKEEYVWGFRTGMLTFSARAALSDEALYGALEKKAAGAIRSAISNCSHPAQSILVKAMSSESFAEERRQKKDTLEARAKVVQKILSSPDFNDLWEAYPFNAGYFMCLKLKGLDADTYRKHLLDKYGVGVIADGERDIRVAFSAVDADNLPALYESLASAARDLLDGNGDGEGA
ncbi:MAG: aminotransferase class I/II-fold pyridoxal phosphate-dependent enzyme [Armatimonadota bacterium]|nr:aminotransferase class I/II-fold pyridoxal phosphate-dependent enzyme [Armatimonadota bacterium]